MERRKDNVQGKSILLIVACREKGLRYKNGKWGPQIQSIRCHVDIALKNEAIIAQDHLTELTCKSSVMITLVHNHKIRCQSDLSLRSSNIPQLEEASMNLDFTFKNSYVIVNESRLWHTVGIQ